MPNLHFELQHIVDRMNFGSWTVDI